MSDELKTKKAILNAALAKLKAAEDALDQHIMLVQSNEDADFDSMSMCNATKKELKFLKIWQTAAADAADAAEKVFEDAVAAACAEAEAAEKVFEDASK